MIRRTPPVTVRSPAPRAGFTLIELMVVILIIGILAAMLLPAMNGVRIRAREAEVTAEIKNFDAAIAQFKERYGTEPPSFVVLYEQGEGVGDPDWSTDTSSTYLPAGNQDQYRRDSRSIIRGIWPDFDFTYSSFSGNHVDLNGDMDFDDVVVLNGAECLVFFLGGVLERADTDGDGTPDSWRNSGFAANPRSPFLPPTAADNRVGPFFEFDPGRFTDIDVLRGVDPNPGDPEMMPEYLDTLPGQQMPYQFLSSYGGRGYQQWGLDDDPSTLEDNELMHPSFGLTVHYLLEPPSPPKPLKPFNPNSYQIISPGYDNEFGAGGFYDGENVPPARAAERDDITNFKRGRLN